MNLQNRFRTAWSVLSNKQLSNSLGSVVRNYSGQQEFNPRKQVYGITYKAIDKIGQAISTYEPLPKKKNGDAYENHPIKNLASRPNPNYTGTKFHRLWEMYDKIYGESFWYLARGESTRKVKEVYLLNPEQMELVVSDDGEVVGYVMHKNNGQQIPFELEEIYHDKTPNPFNPMRGLSVLERAATYVDIELVTASFTLNYMKNNASPSGIVTLPNMDKETFRQFTQQWREGYEGPNNAGKTAFIRGGETEFKAVGATLKDVDQKITREMAKEDVLMMFDIPKGLLGTSGDKGLGRSEMEALEYVFAKYAVQPVMETLDEIWLHVGKMGGLIKDDVVKIDHESPIPADKAYQLEKRKAGVNVWLTVNEVREQEGLPPLKGEQYDTIMPANQAASIAQPTKSATKVVMKKVEPEVKKDINKDQEEFRAKLVEKNEIYEKKMKTAISKFALEQENTVIDKINVSSKAYEEWLFEVKEESEKLALLLAPIIIALMEDQAKDVQNFITGELLEITPEIRAKVDLEMKEIAGVYNADTIQKLEQTISEGQAAGESLPKIKKRVESVYTDAKGYRAERIARTESLRASNTTAELSYKQSGFKTVKWVTNPGACEFCLTLEGQVRSIGGKYLNQGDVITTASGNQMKMDYRTLDVPPVHPNCTCSLVPED